MPWGVPHQNDPRYLMYPAYRRDYQSWSPLAAGALVTSLGHRTQVPSDPRAEAEALLTYYNQQPVVAKKNFELAPLLQKLKYILQTSGPRTGAVSPNTGRRAPGVAQPTAPPPLTLSADLPEKAQNQFATIAGKVQDGDSRGVLKTAVAFAHKYPKELTVQLLACEVETQNGVPAPDTCAAASALALAQRQPHGFVHVARIAYQNKRHDVALGALETAVPLLTAPSQMSAETWALAARLYLGLGRVSKAQAMAQNISKDSAKGSSPRQGVETEITKLKNRFGLGDLDRRRGVNALGEGSAESAYIQAFERALVAIERKNWVQARTHIKTAKKALPRAPGAHALDCELAMRENQPRSALRHCRKALRAQEPQPRVHMLMGLLLAPATRGRPENTSSAPSRSTRQWGAAGSSLAGCWMPWATSGPIRCCRPNSSTNSAPPCPRNGGRKDRLY